MNYLEFFYGKLKYKLGIYNNKKWLGIANKNTFLLREAEELLGKYAWQDVTHVTALVDSSNTIKNISNEQSKIKDQISEINSDKNSHDNIHQVLNNLDVKIKTLEDKKRPFYNKIGKFLTDPNNISVDNCKSILKKHKDIYFKIKELRKIILNSVRLVKE